MAPLDYRTTLTSGEVKKGFVDISNPDNQTVRVRTSVQAFRQTNNDGVLEFYDSGQLKAGVKLDLDEFDLGPHEAVRMYFLLDGKKLPSGDVFGAIFATTEPQGSENGVGQTVRLGTLLSITNGTPSDRQATITKLSVPWLKLGDTINGSYDIKNTADKNKATGFYPTVRISAAPLGGHIDQQGKLTFAGITRTNNFQLKIFPLGLFRVSASYQGQSVSHWVLVVSPGALVILFVILLVLFAAHRLYKRRSRRRSLRLGQR